MPMWSCIADASSEEEIGLEKTAAKPSICYAASSVYIYGVVDFFWCQPPLLFNSLCYVNPERLTPNLLNVFRHRIVGIGWDGTRRRAREAAVAAHASASTDARLFTYQFYSESASMIDPRDLRPTVTCHDLDSNLLNALSAVDNSSRRTLQESLTPKSNSYSLRGLGTALRNAGSGAVGSVAAVASVAEWLWDLVTGGPSFAF